MILRDQDGKSVSLDDKPLGSGGEADVLPVTGQPKLAAKIYKAYSAERTSKLKAMIEAPPQDVARNKGHISICWPVGKLFNSADRCVGFLMPRLDFTNYRELLVLYNPQDRREEAPTFTWHYLVKTAENLSIVVTSVNSTLSDVICAEAYRSKCGMGTFQLHRLPLHASTVVDAAHAQSQTGPVST